MRCNLVFIIIAAALLPAGCTSSSINKAQFDRIRLGMSVSSVEEILGKGKNLEASEVQQVMSANQGPADNPIIEGEALPTVHIDTTDLKGMRWGNDRKNITVIFQNGQVFRLFQVGL